MTRDRQEPSESDGSTLRVTDPEDYNTQRRLQQLHDAREQFPRIRREARSKYNPSDERHSELTEGGYHERVANALLDYLQEVEPVVVSLDESHEATAMWRKQPVDDAEATPDLTLQDILEQAGKRQTEDDGMAFISDDMSRKAFRQANSFLSEVGLGLDLDTGGLPTITGFDASGDDVEAGLTNAQMNGDPPV